MNPKFDCTFYANQNTAIAVLRREGERIRLISTAVGNYEVRRQKRYSSRARGNNIGYLSGMDKVTKRTPMAGNSTLCEEFFQSHVAANVCAEDNMQQAMLITEAKSGIGSDLAHHFANQGIFSSYMEEIKKEHSARRKRLREGSGRAEKFRCAEIRSDLAPKSRADLMDRRERWWHTRSLCICRGFFRGA
jgi:hypothetical protein